MKNLFLKIDDAYFSSDIYKKNITNPKFYTLCNSVPKIERPLIVEFNPSENSNSKRQTLNNLNPIIGWNDTSSLKKIKPFIDKHYPHINTDEFNQAFFCFFNSKKNTNISKHDIKLCEPIFLEFISKIKPKFVLSFSSIFFDTLNKKNMIRYLSEKSVFNGNEWIKVYHGFVNYGNWWSYTYFLPETLKWVKINNKEETLKQLWKICSNIYPYEIRLTDFLNYLIENGETPSLSENPLDEKNIRVELFAHDIEKINISNVSFFKNRLNYFENIDDYDIFDLTAINRCSLSMNGMEIFQEYLIDKKSGLSNDKLIEKYFDKEEYDWSYFITKIGLQKLFIYTKYLNEYTKYITLIND